MIKILLTVCAMLIGSHAHQATSISKDFASGPVTAEFTAGMDTYLDGPKLAGAANESTFEWWYFDAISSSSNASVVIILYNNGPKGFFNQDFDGPFSLSITGLFPNGTAIDREVGASGAVIKTNRSGISAVWKDAGVTFVGSNLARGEVVYTLTVDSPDTLGVEGSITWKSTAPPHYPCSMDRLGANEEIMPHLGWSSAVPDATVSVDLLFNGTDAVSFNDGIGYHDKTWGDQAFSESVSQWYRGHGRLGPYSVVVFDSLDVNDRKYNAGFVTDNSRVLEVSCTRTSVVTRPWGSNSEYPPTAASQPPEGLGLQFQLGDGSNFTTNYTSETVIVSVPGFLRTIGIVEGGIEGGQKYKGRMMFEQITSIPGETKGSA